MNHGDNIRFFFGKGIMERIILEPPQCRVLTDTLEEATGLRLPHSNKHLCVLQFIIYNPEQHQFSFQIRWGVRNIFMKKNIAGDPANIPLNTLNTLIQRNSKKIREELIKGCREHLNDVVISELPLEINRQMPAFREYKVFVDIPRSFNHPSNNNGWPEFSLFVAWDDWDEFQEFVEPLSFDYRQGQFRLEYPEIVGRLKRFRDLI
jgi:hypothetical protein